MSEALASLSLTERLTLLGEAAEKGWMENGLTPTDGSFYEWDYSQGDKPLCGCCLLTAAYVERFGVGTGPTRWGSANATTICDKVCEEFGLALDDIHRVQQGFDDIKAFARGGGDAYQFGLAMRKKTFATKQEGE